MKRRKETDKTKELQEWIRSKIHQSTDIKPEDQAEMERCSRSNLALAYQSSETYSLGLQDKFYSEDENEDDSWETISSSSDESNRPTSQLKCKTIVNNIKKGFYVPKYKKMLGKLKKTKQTRLLPDCPRIQAYDNITVLYERIPTDDATGILNTSRQQDGFDSEDENEEDNSWETVNSSSEVSSGPIKLNFKEIFDKIEKGLYNPKYKKMLGKSKDSSKMIRLLPDPPKIHVDLNTTVLYERSPSDDTIGILEPNRDPEGYFVNTGESRIGLFQHYESADEDSDVSDDLTTEEKQRVAEFIKFTVNDKISFKRNEEEVNQIKEAVDEAVTLIANEIGRQIPLLEMSHKYSVGSMAEGTRVLQPNEFDYLIVTKQFWSKDNIKVEPAFSELECQCKSRHDDDILKGTIYSPTPEEIKKMSKPHAHVKLLNKTEAKQFGKYYRYVTNPREQLHPKVIRIPCINKSMGKLKQNMMKFARGIEDKEMHGPALTFAFTWYPSNTSYPELDLNVDFVLAIELEGVDTILKPGDVDISLYEKRLREDNRYLLVSDFDTKFDYAFTNVEVALMRDLSAAHRMCYKFLKFLFKCSLMHEKSYFLKTCLLRHAAECEDHEDLYSCIKGTLSKINVEKSTCFSVRSLFLSDLKIKFVIGIGDALKHKKKLLERVKSAGRLNPSEFENFFQYIKGNPIYENFVRSNVYIPASERYTLRQKIHNS